MRKIIYLLFTLCLMSACDSGKITTFETKNVLPTIFPEYSDVTIPVNIAPLNFKLAETCEAIQVIIKGKSDEIICHGTYKISIPAKKWQCSSGEEYRNCSGSHGLCKERWKVDEVSSFFLACGGRQD